MLPVHELISYAERKARSVEGSGESGKTEVSPNSSEKRAEVCSFLTVLLIT